MMVSAGLNVLFQVQTAAERLDAARAGLDIPLAERLIGIIGIATMLSGAGRALRLRQPRAVVSAGDR